MGKRGPVPKRDDQRRRRNKTDPKVVAKADGVNRAPKLTGNHCAVAKRFWQRLGESAQAQFFQPSDWAMAEMVVMAIDNANKSGSAAAVKAAMDGMSKLLVTEADRRRVRMELEPADEVDPEEAAADARILRLVDKLPDDESGN